MKRLFSITVLMLFTYIQVFNGLVWMSYEINKSEIIQKFCENKDKPELKCEGTCHMKKMMLTEESDEGEPLPILPEIQLYVNNIGIEVLNAERIIKRNTTYINLYSFTFLNDWEIPPKA